MVLQAAILLNDLLIVNRYREEIQKVSNPPSASLFQIRFEKIPEIRYDIGRVYIKRGI